MQARSVNSLENVSISLLGDCIYYTQNYPVSEETQRRFRAALDELPLNTELTPDKVPRILIPGEMPEGILNNLVFRDDLEKVANDSMHLHLNYKSVSQRGESKFFLKPQVLIAFDRKQPRLSVSASVSFDVKDGVGEMQTDLTLLGKEYAERYKREMILVPLRSGREVHAIHFLPIENAGYLFNALMHLSYKIDKNHLNELYALRHASENIEKCLPSLRTNFPLGRKLSFLADAAYKEKQEELIDMLDSPFYTGREMYCQMEGP